MPAIASAVWSVHASPTTTTSRSMPWFSRTLLIAYGRISARLYVAMTTDTSGTLLWRDAFSIDALWRQTVSRPTWGTERSHFPVSSVCVTHFENSLLPLRALAKEFVLEGAVAKLANSVYMARDNNDLAEDQDAGWSGAGEAASAKLNASC
jgi:hypothetical protein